MSIFTRKRLWHCLTILPLLFLVYWIAQLAIDMPYLDSWALVPLLQKFFDGDMSFADLFAQHNESRIPLLRLLVIAGAVLSDWNTNHELVLIALLAGLIFWLLARQATLTCRQCAVIPPPWLWAAMAPLFFSVIQHENWTFGLTITGAMNCAGAVAGMALLTRPFFSWRRLCGALLAGAVALFSYSNGVLFFGAALLPIMAGMRESRRYRALPFLVWIGATTALIAGFFTGYRSTFQLPDAEYYFAHADQLLKYFFMLLGGAIANSPRLPDWIPVSLGIAGCGLFVFTSLRSFTRTSSEFRELSFWTALGIYTLLTALAVAAGRCFFFGVSNALSSRYAMISSLFWICALIPAVVEFGGGATTAMTAAFRRILAVFMLACACLFLISSADNLMVWRARHQTLLAVRNELLCDIPDQSLLTRSYTSWPLLQPRMKFLSERKLSVFREKRAFLEYHPVTTNAGKTDNIRSNQPPTPWLNPNLLEINGRAYDAGEKAPARRVILVDSHDMIIASAPVARAADFRQAAWRITLSSAKFPVDTDVKLRVYAVMRDNARIARIGALTVNFPPATNQAMPADFSFNHTHREIAGWSDFFRADAKQAYGSGWARDPATGRAGEWILLTDASTNILGYARVDMDRPDVAQQLHAPQLLKCGWRIAVHQSIPGAGRHVLSAWLLLPEDRQALKLANDFEVTNYFRGESPRK